MIGLHHDLTRNSQQGINKMNDDFNMYFNTLIGGWRAIYKDIS